ncbi:hypothetical protein HMPREF0201_01489 [Cedecea davisae DSM 4568]|uniref:Uncharacterized protein n=1 Tax=Cedecea davisae DSM 4568 TaxID=566551 RepID=S3IWI5_9ENTR|nr:hypothetical protein HMPREF0201_01489 [Cedecea davisae DSM 4568]
MKQPFPAPDKANISHKLFSLRYSSIAVVPEGYRQKIKDS